MASTELRDTSTACCSRSCRRARSTATRSSRRSAAEARGEFDLAEGTIYPRCIASRTPGSSRAAGRSSRAAAAASTRSRTPASSGPRAGRELARFPQRCRCRLRARHLPGHCESDPRVLSELSGLLRRSRRRRSSLRFTRTCSRQPRRTRSTPPTRTSPPGARSSASPPARIAGSSTRCAGGTGGAQRVAAVTLACAGMGHSARRPSGAGTGAARAPRRARPRHTQLPRCPRRDHAPENDAPGETRSLERPGFSVGATPCGVAPDQPPTRARPTTATPRRGRISHARPDSGEEAAPTSASPASARGASRRSSRSSHDRDRARARRERAGAVVSRLIPSQSMEPTLLPASGCWSTASLRLRRVRPLAATSSSSTPPRHWSARSTSPPRAVPASTRNARVSTSSSAWMACRRPPVDRETATRDQRQEITTSPTSPLPEFGELRHAAT